jgi:hypothetical protein
VLIWTGFTDVAELGIGFAVVAYAAKPAVMVRLDGGTTIPCTVLEYRAILHH